jgi:hypothetical protein
MFGFGSKRSETPVSRSIITPVVGSKHVRHAITETYEVSLPIDATAEAIAHATLELETYADAIGYPNEKAIKSRTEDNRLLLWFDGPQTVHGTDYNTQVYKNITWVEDLVPKIAV